MRLRFMAACFLLGTPLTWAAYGDGDAHLHKLYESFIAPCCWRENLTAHQSPAADQLRSRILGLIEEGQSDSQIQQALVSEFGPRILSLPEGTPRLWLFWTPAVMLAFGALALVWLLRRMRHSPLQPAYDGPPADLGPGWDRE